MAVTGTVTQQMARVEVFNVNGGPKITIPVSCYTATDCLRLMVAEATPATATKRNAQHALSNIRLLPGESWPSAIDRQTQARRRLPPHRDRGTPLPAEAAGLKGVSKPTTIGGVAGRRKTAEMPPRVPNTGATTAAQAGATTRHPRGRQGVPPPPSTATTDTVGGPRKFATPTRKREAPRRDAGAAEDRTTRRFRAASDRAPESVASIRQPPQPVEDAPHPTASDGKIQSGAGEGNYASVEFIHAVQRHVFHGKNIISKRGRGFLHATNPTKDEASQQQGHGSPSSEGALLAALDLGSTAWEDSATLKWPVYLAHKQVVPRRVSVETDALTHGPRPFSAQQLVVFPLRPFDPEKGADIGVARGVQWWTPGTARTKTIEAGVQVVTAYTTNCEDVERMRLLKEPVPPQVEPEPPPVLPRTSEPKPDTPDEGIRDGKPRLTIYYRAFNAVTKGNSGGIGTISTNHHRVRKSKWFTLLDLPQAYHQIPIKASDRHKTAFRDAGCIERCLDDILIHTETLEEHFKVLDDVLDLLQKAGYSGHFRKSVFCMPKVEFLGVMDFSTKRGRHNHIPWGQPQEDARAVVSALVSPSVLQPPDRELPLGCQRARCRSGAHPALVEHRDSAIGFGSHRWTVAESRRAPTDREKGPAGQPIDTSLPDDTSSPSDRIQEPLGPILDGVPLQDLALAKDAEERDPTPESTTVGDNKPPGGTPTLDGTQLAALGVTEVAAGPELPLPVIWALQHTLEKPDPTDTEDLQSKRSPRCREKITEAKPEVVIGNACRRYDPDHIGNTAARQATDVIDGFLSSRAKLLVMECPVRFTGTMEWKETLKPRLERGWTTAAAWALAEFTLPPMLREVFSTLEICGVVSPSADTCRSLADDILFSFYDIFADSAESAVDIALQEPRFTDDPVNLTPALVPKTSPMEVDDASGPPAPPPPNLPPGDSAEQPEAPDSHGDDEDERQHSGTTQNVARVMQHLCTWLKVALAYGPVNHPRAQGAVISILLDRLCFTVQMNERPIRQRRVVAADVKPFHQRPDHLQLDFEDVWSADLGLAGTPIVAVPLYTLTARELGTGTGGSGTWAWEYRGRYQDGAQSGWITDDEAQDSFSPLQLDVFHALRELNRPGEAPRPQDSPPEEDGKWSPGNERRRCSSAVQR
eukprot:g2451.t1